MLGGNPKSDRIVLGHRGKAFEYLQQDLSNVRNDAVVLTMALWVLIDVSSFYWLTRLLTLRSGYCTTTQRQLLTLKD
jgi:hypothetical protein